MLVKRICPYGKREQVRIFLLEVLHIAEPFTYQDYISPPDVNREMLLVGGGELRQIGSCLKLFGQVKNRPEQLRKRLVLEQVLVFQKPQEKIAFPAQKELKPSQVVLPHVDIEIVLLKVRHDLVKPPVNPVRLHE